MASDFEFVGTLDVSQIRRGLQQVQKDLQSTENQGKKNFSAMGKQGRQEIRQLGFALQRFGIQGVAAWGEIFAAAGVAGLAIGAVVVTVLGLVKAFQTLASAGVRAFKQLTQLGVETAKEYEIAGAQFRAVLQGDEQAAEATLKRIQALSRQVGQNLTGVARAFLPEVETLDQLEEILRIATALAQFQPEQGILGARIALQEFISGETRSLRRRFEIPQADIDRIQEAFETGGIGAAIEELNRFLDDTGRSLEALSDTADVAFNRMREGFRQLAGVFGEPIAAAAKEEIDDINSLMDDLRPTLEVIAQALGEVVGKFVDLVGTEVQDFIRGIDFNNILEMVIALDGAYESFQLVIEQFGLATKAAEGFNTLADRVTLTLLDLEGAFLNLAIAIAENRRELQELYAQQADVAGVVEDAFDLAGKAADSLLPGALGEGVSTFLEFPERVAGIGAGMSDALADVDQDIQDLNQGIEDYFQRRAQFLTGLALRVAEAEGLIGEGTEEGEARADAIRSEAEAYDQLLEILPQIAEAEEEVNTAREEFQEEAASRALDIETRYQRALLDIRIENARRFIEIEEQTLQKFEDLRIEYNSRFEKIRLDLTRDEEDIARRQARRQLEVEKDLVDDKIEIEKDYRRRLEEIRRRFDFEAAEAIRANDAIAYLRIQRRLAFELNEAKIQRDEDVEDAREKAEKRRQELKDIQAQELEDARINNKRKLEDLNTYLAEETAEINLWNQREHEKREERWRQERFDAQEARRRQLEDYRDWWVEHYNQTEEGIATHLSQLEEWRRQVISILNSFPNLFDLVPAGIGALGGPGGRGARGAQLQEQRQRTQQQRERFEQQQTNQLRGLAYQYGVQLGHTPTELRDWIESLTLPELQDLVRQWQEELRGRQFGGPVGAGQLFKTGEPFGNIRNPELYLPNEQLQGAVRGAAGALGNLLGQLGRLGDSGGGTTGPGGTFDLGRHITTGDPTILGKEAMELFTPKRDGYIIPLRLLSRVTGTSQQEIQKAIEDITRHGSFSGNKSKDILSAIGIQGRAFGGPVRAGEPIWVGEPLGGNRPNPELFLPGIVNISLGRITGMMGRRGRRLPDPTLPRPGAGGGFGDPAGRPRPGTDPVGALPPTPRPSGAFPLEDLALRQMFFSPPFIPSAGGTTIDNSRRVEVVQPEVNPGLSEIEIAQVKDLYTKLRLEETLL